MTILENIDSQISILEIQIKNYNEDLKSSINWYGDEKKISPYCADTNLANMSAMASEIKCRKFAINLLNELKTSIKIHEETKNES